MRKVVIDPITRLEGHGRIDIVLDDAGDVAETYLVIPEIRGFETFLEGRPIEEMARITPRICGVCPEAHHAAAAKAADAVYGVRIPVAAELIRRLQYNAFTAGDHATHFYALGGPDFIVGSDGPPEKRNLIGVIEKVGLELGSRVIRMRREAHEVAELLGGKRIHPVGMIPGGVSQAVSPETRDRLVEIGTYMVEFARQTQQVFADIVLADPRHVDLLRSDGFNSRTYYAALVDADGHADVYDGDVRVVDPDGAEVARYDPSAYLQHIAEHVETWSYLKFPYLKQVGWNGFTEGPASGIVRVGPLGMLNASTGMKTPLAREEYERFFATLGGAPVHATLAYHWARIIEMLQAAELVLQHATDERLTDPEVRVVPTATPTEGVGTVEAPRGLLTHHYVTDAEGIVRRANLIVGTTYNYPAIQVSVKKAAQQVLSGGREATEPLLNTIEMAFRAYDPCFGCATHAMRGAMPMTVNLIGPDGGTLRTLRRDERGTEVST
jgi:F420-non-reducing hydrogenase large subunit